MSEENSNYRIYSEKEWEKYKGTSNSLATYGGSKENIYGDSHLIYTRVYLAGKEAFQSTNIDITLTQELNTHHFLEMICDPDEFNERNAYLLENSRDYLGKKISIEFKQFGKTASVFTGVITDILFRKKDGVKQVVFTAHSPTILLENGIHQRSFENATLEEIIQKIGGSYPQDLVSFSLNPNLKEKLLYTVQQESDWAFIQRLSVRYGEYTFFNGTDVVVSPWGSKIIELNEEEELFDYEVKMGIAPQQFAFQAYHPEQSQSYTETSDRSEVSSSQNPFLNHALNASKVFTGQAGKMYEQGSLLQNSSELSGAVQREVRKRQNLVYVDAKTGNPSLRLGDVVKLNAWMPGHALFKSGSVPIESYRIISITHYFSENEGYYNILRGVPKDLAVPPYAEEEFFPKSSVQHAVVTDNKDPQKMGRVRIQFPWQKEENQQTPWVQVLQPHAGSGKGTYINPEIGESVLAGFFSGNAERPFVLGTAYNGGEIAAYYTQGNDIKVIQTRSGTKIVFNDAEGQGSILVEDPSGNKLFMDGEGNILVHAPKNFSVSAGEDIVLSAGKNMVTSVGVDQTTSVGANAHTTVGMQYTLFAADIFETASGNITSDSSQTVRNASEAIESSTEQGSVIQNAQSVVRNNSGEKSTNF